MSEQPDPIIRAALDDVQVPEYEPGFWDRLDARLAPTDTPPPDDPDTDSTDVHAPLVELATHRRARDPGRRRLVLVAAAAVVVVALILQIEVREDSVRTASRPNGASTTTSATNETDPLPTLSAPEATLRAWLDAIGTADTATALRLTGPRTQAYYDALGADMTGIVTEWGEGYGAWADSDDLSTAVVNLPELDGHAIAVVTVSGTWAGEGTAGYRTEAIPVVENADGTWSAEPAAFDPDREGRLELTSPPPGETGLETIPPTGIIELISGGVGTYYFAIDGANPTATSAGQRGAPVQFDPPGTLQPGTHQLLVAQVDAKNITAQVHTVMVKD